MKLFMKKASFHIFNEIVRSIEFCLDGWRIFMHLWKISRHEYTQNAHKKKKKKKEKINEAYEMLYLIKIIITFNE